MWWRLKQSTYKKWLLYHNFFHSNFVVMLLITLQKNIKWLYTNCFCAKGKNMLQSFRPTSYEIKFPFYLLSWSGGDWKITCELPVWITCHVYICRTCICGSLKHQAYATNVACKSLLCVPWCLGHMLFRLPLHTSGLQMRLSSGGFQPCPFRNPASCLKPCRSSTWRQSLIPALLLPANGKD